jgi:hypothetical protein
MSSGSGPYPAVVSAFAVAVTETIIATFPPGNWNNPSGLGNLIDFAGVFTPPATGGSLVLRVRQGTAITGTQAGPTVTLPVVASTATPCAIAVVDQSAFAGLQTGGQYVVTAQYAAAAGGAVTGVATFETCSTIN